jgi:hypothetical protein
MYIAAQQRADQQTQARANDLLIQYIHQHPRAQWDGVIWDLCTYRPFAAGNTCVRGNDAV